MINNQNKKNGKDRVHFSFRVLYSWAFNRRSSGFFFFVFFLTYLSVKNKQKNTSHFPVTTAALVADNSSHEKFYNGEKSSPFYHIMPQTERDLFTTSEILFLSI